jgi:hypothetical protein
MCNFIIKLEVVRVEVEEQETAGANLDSFRLWKPRDTLHAVRIVNEVKALTPIHFLGYKWKGYLAHTI